MHLKLLEVIFDCQYNNIKSFEYFPSFVKDDFYCGVIQYMKYGNYLIDCTKIELLNDFDIFRMKIQMNHAIFIDRLNDFLLTIGKDPVEKSKWI